MKKLLSLLLPATLLLSGCTWLPAPREMGDMALLRTMGVDTGEEGVTLTVSTGPRARGLQGEQQPALKLSARQPSLSAAALNIQGLSDSFVFFGYVDQLLLGEALARESVAPVLDWFARDVELGLGAQMWIIRDTTAQKAVESGGDRGVEERLTTLRTDGRLGIAAVPRTAGEVYADILELGSAYVPALILGEGEDAALTGGGYAVLKGDALAGFLTGEQVQGLELLAGKPSANVLAGRLGDAPASVRVYRSATTSRFGQDGRLKLSCRIWARLAEYDRQPDEEELEGLREQIQQQEEIRIRSVLGQLREWEADCLGLGAKAGLTSPGQWKEFQEGWPGRFGRLEPELTVRVELVR